MAWTSVAKPTSSVWTSTNPPGKEQYDQASLTYDSASTYYDGYNPAQWTDVAKPMGGYDVPWSQMYFTWNNATGTWSGTNSWNKINKPT